MEYKIIGYVLLGLLGLYVAFRMLGQYAFSKLIKSEIEHVVDSDKFKVKGRFE
ncbi:hypothetical protein KY319_05135 [Candidatus Woesearchaeota archaeon]|nr:hypothetical protein [Candidatus Woesearchaeota archaeon]